MSRSIIRYLSDRSLVEGSRAYSATYGDVVIVAFTGDGYATVAPEAGACPFGDVRIRDLSAIGGEA